jgi:hypothetical protein
MSGETASPPDIIHLLQYTLAGSDADSPLPVIRKIASALSIPTSQIRAARALTSPGLTCYLPGFPAGDTELAAMRASLADVLCPAAGTCIELSRLRLVASHCGAATGEEAGYHYVVRTDVLAGCEQELQRWYDEEHMPMLAAVPGTVRACRLVSVDAAPRFYACYDLLVPEVLESAAWLQARDTPWSERVRPTFTNTQRVMSRLVNGLPAC